MKTKIIFIVTAIMCSMLLLFVDEGRYSFDFFSDGGNIFFLFVFMALFFGGQMVVMEIISEYPVKYKTVQSVVLGLPLGFLTYYLLLFIFVGLSKLF